MKFFLAYYNYSIINKFFSFFARNFVSSNKMGIKVKKIKFQNTNNKIQINYNYQKSNLPRKIIKIQQKTVFQTKYITG